jgi:hypothetical protein
LYDVENQRTVIIKPAAALSAGQTRLLSVFGLIALALIARSLQDCAKKSEVSQSLISNTVVIFAVLVVAAFIRSGMRTKRRMEDGSIARELNDHSQQLARSFKDRRLPPELKLPTPRPVKSASLATRLSYTVPRLMLLSFLMAGTYAFLCLLRTMGKRHVVGVSPDGTGTRPSLACPGQIAR